MATKVAKLPLSTFVPNITVTGINDEVNSGLAITRNITYEKLAKKILNKSRDEAVKSEKAKSQFLARVSHDIRTPLNAIMGFGEQLLQTELSERQREYVGIIDKSSEHLLTLINDILVYSKIEADQLSFESNSYGHSYARNEWY